MPVDLSIPWALAPAYNQNEGFCAVKQSGLIRSPVLGYAVLLEGQLVAEEYVAPYSMNNQTAIWSATKSWSSLLIGTLVDKGELLLNETLADIWPDDADWADVKDAVHKKQATVYELLTMSSGFVDHCAHPVHSEGHVLRAAPFGRDFPSETVEPAAVDLANWNDQETFQDAMNYLDYSRPRDGSFYYCCLCHTLAWIIEKKTGMEPLEYALSDNGTGSSVFGQLGISADDITWEGMTSAAGSFMAPRTMLKLGALYLQDGHAGDSTGSSVISSEWVLQSSTGHMYGMYGYQWWIDYYGPGSTCAVGYGGNIICYYPELDAVIAITGSDGHYGNYDGSFFGGPTGDIAASRLAGVIVDALVEGKFATEGAC